MITFDLGKVMLFYSKMKAMGKAKRSLQEAMSSFKVEEAVERAEKLVKSGEAFVVPCITGEGGVKEIDGYIFVEIC